MAGIVNPELLRHARHFVNLQAAQEAELEKTSFLDAASMGGQDPSAAGGGAADPSAAAPPAGGDPSGGGGGGFDPSSLMPLIQQAVQQALASGGGAGGAGGAAAGAGVIKPKIDVNIELMQIKKMIAKICDSMGIVIPAADMAATSQDLTQMAQQQNTPPPQQSAISPISPIQGASPDMAAAGGTKTSQYGVYRGEAVPYQEAGSGMDELSDKAAALSLLIQANRNHAA